MEHENDAYNTDEEAGEAQLAELIKLAGDDARKRWKAARACHAKLVQDAVNEGVAQRQKTILK